MGVPRDYLEFTTWYLQNKGYITRADNADFKLTMEGVDFVESQRMNIPILNKLLTNGTEPFTADGVATTKSLISPPRLLLRCNGSRFPLNRRSGSSPSEYFRTRPPHRKSDRA
jgi:hypothetical protein